jgi:hypothetical protein
MSRGFAISSPETPTMPDWISALSNAALAIAAVLGVVAWRAQLRGGAEFDAARHFLKSALKVRDYFNFTRTRSKWVSVPEGASYRDFDFAKANLKTYHARWDALVRVMEELEVAADEARVFWMEEVDTRMVPFRESCEDLRLRIIELGESTSVRADPDEVPEIRRRFFMSLSPPDPLTENVQSAVVAVDALCSAFIRGRSLWARTGLKQFTFFVWRACRRRARVDAG